MEKENSVAKKQWSDAERLELAAKLDADLDAFIDSLEKKRYEDGWPEDRWQEEMDKHPFFMKREPKPGDEVHPMFEGLQKLKYDPEENTKEELALNYKEDGNFYMKHKKFRMAIYSFSEAIKAKCENPEIMAVLYNNRSAANFFLENYRYALKDADKALEYKSDYPKARWRAAQSALMLNEFDLCLKKCLEILELDPSNENVKTLMKTCKNKKSEMERNERKAKSEAKKRFETFQRLCDALKARNVKFDNMPNGSEQITKELLQPKFLPLEEHPVHLHESDNQTLVWPAAFSYPQFLLSDFHTNLSESMTMEECLSSMLEEPLPYDTSGKYQVPNLSVYYENRKVGKPFKVNLTKTIKEIVREKDFFVSGGSLLFYVVPKDSQVEKEFLNEQRRPRVYQDVHLD